MKEKRHRERGKPGGEDPEVTPLPRDRKPRKNGVNTGIDQMEIPELAESVASINAILHDIASAVTEQATGLQLIDDELSLIRQRAFPPPPAPRNAADWPWAPGTLAQGFLGGRWNRRDGNVYATAQFRGAPGPNSPIRGGDDSESQVSVTSGVRRS